MSNQMDYEINKELGECYLFMREFDKAEDYYNKAAEAMPTQSAPFMGLATIAMQRGEVDNAITLYGKALNLEKTDKSLAGLGLAKMQNGDNADAFNYFVESLHMNPENAVAMNCMVRLGYQDNRLEEVTPFLEAALEVNPHNEPVQISLAGCYMTLGKMDEAKKNLESVLAENPSNNSAQELYAHIKVA